MWLGNDLPDDIAGQECVPGDDGATGGGPSAAPGGGDPGVDDPLGPIGPVGAAAHRDEHDPLPFDQLTAVDLDGDGVLETMIVHDGDEITLSYDLDGDGRTDYETVFDGHGHSVSWQDQRDDDGTWHWRRVDG